MLSEYRRTILGAFVLIIVNIVWVLSSELTNYIFHKENYNKPFLSTYLKSSIFSLFLVGFIFSTHWRILSCPHRYYTDPYLPIENSETIEKNILSDPIYVPVNGDSSDNECDDKNDDGYVVVEENDIHNFEKSSEMSRRSVKFSKYSEVRHLSDTYAEDCLEARLSYSASKALRKRLMIRKIIDQGYLPATNVMKIGLQFCFFWFIANYSYQIALSKDSPAVINVVSCTSSLFTLILAAIFPSTPQDKFNITKLVVVIFSMSGVVLLSFADYIDNGKFHYEGILWGLVSAVGYAVYLVNLRRNVKNENQMSLPMFFGFVGFWTIIFLWPGLLILNLAQIEIFEMPTKFQLGSILLNGFLGTLGAELLWLWGCFLTSSLTATLSLGLTIPLSMIADYVIYKKNYDWKFYCGSIPILVSFICIAYLTNNAVGHQDPIGSLLKKIFCKIRGTTNYEPLAETDSDSEEINDSSRASPMSNKIITSNSTSQMTINNALTTPRTTALLFEELFNPSVEESDLITDSKITSYNSNVMINSQVTSINSDSFNDR